MYGFSLYKIIIYTVYRVIFAPLANSFVLPLHEFAQTKLC